VVFRSRVSAALVFLVVLAGCGGGGGTGSGPVPPGPSSAPATKHVQDVIKHVVVIVQENRSFDNLFQGFPGADTAASGRASDGSTVPLKPVSMAHGVDPNHDFAEYAMSLDGGKMDGFDLVPGFPRNEKNLAYAYVPRAEVQPYFDLAKSYALADRMFQSNNSASYVAHQYIIAAQSATVVDNPINLPWGCDAPAGTGVTLMGVNGAPYPAPNVPPCFDYKTIGDLLDAAGKSWAYYAPAIVPVGQGDPAGALWTPYDAIRHIRYGPDWSQDQISPETTILGDIAHNTLRNVSIVAPDALNSDHARFPSTTGPAWVSSIVAAIGTSAYWNDTAIFVTWDDWGGWYDHVIPPHIDANGPGFRVPLIAISPFAKHGYVSHAQFETASLTRYIEDAFGLGSLGQRDALTTAPHDMFDYSQSVKPLSGIRLPASVMRAASQRAPSHAAPDGD
jgi:phospholipase C